MVNDTLPDLRVVKDMHARKALMAELADGFIALPVGYGTFEELFEVLAWSQLGWHQKPIGLFDTAGFFRSLLNFLDHTTSSGVIRPSHRELVLVETTDEALLAKLKSFQPATEIKWVS